MKTGVALPGDGDLWVVAPSSGKRGEWKKVGTISGGKKTLSSDPAAQFEGRPIFMIVPP